MSLETETLAAVYSALSGDSVLRSSGIDPSTGAARAVPIYNKVAEDQPAPYVRITLTDSLPLVDEPFDAGQPPDSRQVSVLINAISEYEPETYSITSRVLVVLANKAMATVGYQGTARADLAQYYIDNQSFPNRVYSIGAVRVSCRMEPVT